MRGTHLAENLRRSKVPGGMEEHCLRILNMQSGPDGNGTRNKDIPFYTFAESQNPAGWLVTPLAFVAFPILNYNLFGTTFCLEWSAQQLFEHKFVYNRQILW